MDLFWPRKYREGCFKAEDIAALLLQFLHDEVGNTSNLLSHLKCTTQLYMGLSQNENILRDLCKLICV